MAAKTVGRTLILIGGHGGPATLSLRLFIVDQASAAPSHKAVHENDMNQHTSCRCKGKKKKKKKATRPTPFIEC